MVAPIIFLLDRSGSMETCWDDVLGGFNAFVKEQSQCDYLTLIQFDHEYTMSYSDRKICSVEPLTRETYIPRGTTALLDSIGKMIKETPGGPKTVVIFTDGLENASKNFTKAHVKDLIEQKTNEGWTFIYMGANQDAYAEAGAIGIAPRNTMEYDPRRTPEAFATLSSVVSQC